MKASLGQSVRYVDRSGNEFAAIVIDPKDGEQVSLLVFKKDGSTFVATEVVAHPQRVGEQHSWGQDVLDTLYVMVSDTRAKVDAALKRLDAIDQGGL